MNIKKPEKNKELKSFIIKALIKILFMGLAIKGVSWFYSFSDLAANYKSLATLFMTLIIIAVFVFSFIIDLECFFPQV